MTIAFRDDSEKDFRERIRLMTNAKLLEYGHAAPFMADPKKSSADGKSVNPVYVTQLKLLRDELT